MINFVFFILPSLILSASVSKCCKEKSVGDFLYILHDSGDTSKWGCLDNCIYAEETTLKLYCFAHGNLKVNCEDKKPWCYKGNCGPDTYWTELFPACGLNSQSPINIITANATTAPSAPPLTFINYEKIEIRAFSSNAADDLGEKGDRLENHEFDNNGHTAVLGVKTEYDNDGVMTGGPLGDERYQMLQMHFHWGANVTVGSEHTINGVTYPLELHLVHINNNATELDLAVAGFFFEITLEDNEALTPLIDEIQKILNYDSYYPMSNNSFQVKDLMPSEVGIYYNYAGSLTTPPCSEVVTWIVFLEPLKISASQVAQFRTMMDSENQPIVDNFRPVMPLNGRTVYQYNV